MSVIPYCYLAWVKKFSMAKGEFETDPNKIIHDGDSGYVLFDKGDRNYQNNEFRLYGLNAPEINSPDAAIKAKAVVSRDWLRQQIMGKQVWVRSYGSDKYGRVLLVVWTSEADWGDNKKSLNQKMIDLGLAPKFMGELV